MFFNNKFNTFFGLNLTLVYTFPMCMTWRFHFPLRNYDFKRTNEGHTLRIILDTPVSGKRRRGRQKTWWKDSCIWKVWRYRRRTYWIGQSGRLIFNTIPVKTPEEKKRKKLYCVHKFYMHMLLKYWHLTTNLTIPL